MSNTLHRIHWEFESICPQCGTHNHVKAPAGEKVVRVHCSHCPHGYEYTHMVEQHLEVEDRVQESQVSSHSA